MQLNFLSQISLQFQFEGEITEVKLMELQYRALEIMDEEKDSLIFFKTRQEKWLDKEIIGNERQSLETIL